MNDLGVSATSQRSEIVMLIVVIVLLILAFVAVVLWIDRDRRRHGARGPVGEPRDEVDPGHWTGGGS